MIRPTFRTGAVALSLALAAVSIHSFSGGDGARPGDSEAVPVHRVDRLTAGGETFVRREILANTYRFNRQQLPAVALAADGSLTVAWESRVQDYGRTAAYLQRYDAAGRRVGEETRVGAGEIVHQNHASVASTQVGTWVAWESFDVATRAASLRLRNVDGDAPALVLDEGNVREVTLADAGGGVFAAWIRNDGARDRVQVARCAADGTIQRFAAVTEADENAKFPGIATLGDGGFALVWAAADARHIPAGLRYRTFAANGEPRTPVGSLDAGDPKGSIEPSIAGGANGFAIAWLALNGDHYDVVAKAFDAQGAPAGETVVVSEAKGHQSGAAIAIAQDGTERICVAWNAAENELCKTFDVRARLLGADGSPLGEAFTANAHTAGDQRLSVASNRRALAFGADGRLAFAWTGDGALGDATAAHVTLCVPAAGPSALAATDLTPDRPAPLAQADGVALKLGLLDESDTQTHELQISGPHDPPIYTGPVAQQTGPTPDPNVDAGFNGISNTGWRPPDTHGTVGPNHVVEVVNGGITIFTKTGTALASTTINNFWAPVGSQTFVFDPRVLFDSYSGRFIAIATEHVASTTGYFVVAVSTTDSPTNVTTHWHKYRFDVTADALGYFVDFPHFGVDDKAIYLATNNFNGTFNHMIYILDKAPMLIGAAPPPRKLIRVNGSVNASMALGTHFGTNNAAFGVNEGNQSSTINIYAIRNPIGAGAATLTTFTMAVPSFSGGPADAPQIGTTQLLDSIDKRFSTVVVRGGRLYCAHNWGSPTKCRWYEIALNNWPVSGSPTLVQSGDIDLNPQYAIIPSISVDPYRNILVCFTRSGSTETPSQRRAARAASDAAGLLPDRDLALQSPVSYTTTRWGDYSHVAVDPRDQATFYYFHEYAQAGTSWGTWVGKYRKQAPTLTANKTTMRASQLDSVTFSLSNPAWAGAEYVLLIGASGQTPGFRLPSPPGVINVDLRPDGLTSAGLAAPNSPPFGNFAGVLDGSGNATATFTLPPLPIVGVTFQFAYVQRQAGVWNFASETVSVTMIP
jgi:hypothetical protein